MKVLRTSRAHFSPLVFFPLVNVVLLLLLFFLLGSSLILQPGVAVRMPESSFTMAPQLRAQFISITGGAHPRVYFNDELTSVARLPEHLARHRPEEGSIIIKADRDAPYGAVAGVMEQVLKGRFAVILASAPTRE